MTEPQNSNTMEMPAIAQQGNSVDAILRRLATRAMGLTGADIERIVREARLTPALKAKGENSGEDVCVMICFFLSVQRLGDAAG